MVDEAMMESVPDEAIATFFDQDENEIKLQKLEEAIAKLNVEEKTLITQPHMGPCMSV